MDLKDAQLKTRVCDDGSVLVTGVPEYMAVNRLTLRQVKERLDKANMFIDVEYCKRVWAEWGWEEESIRSVLYSGGCHFNGFIADSLLRWQRAMEADLLATMVAGAQDKLQPLGECTDKIGWSPKRSATL